MLGADFFGTTDGLGGGGGGGAAERAGCCFEAERDFGGCFFVEFDRGNCVCFCFFNSFNCFSRCLSEKKPRKSN